MGALPCVVWEFMNPSAAPLALYGTNEQIASMSMTRWMEEMPIQGADLMRQEVRNEKAFW